MMILTRSRRIRQALRRVQARIPAKDWRAISSFLGWIRTASGWQALGLMSELDKSGGRFLPLYEIGVNVPERKEPRGKVLVTLHELDIRAPEQEKPRGQILFTLPVCRLYSDKALVGLVAHELAHALRATKLGPRWYDKMDRRYPAEERIADAIVSRWGFRSQIRAMRHEQETFVLPLLYSREPQIMRLLEKRAREDCERAERKLLRWVKSRRK